MSRTRSSSDQDSKSEQTVTVAGKIKFGDRTSARVISGRDTVVQTGGGAYIGGNVSTGGGDFVGRDQIQTDYQDQQGVSIAGFVRLLEEIRLLLPQADLEPDVVEVVNGDFRVVEDQAAKDQPRAGVIKAKLKGIAEVIEEMGKASETVVKIVSLLKKGVTLAGALF